MSTSIRITPAAAFTTTVSAPRKPYMPHLQTVLQVTKRAHYHRNNLCTVGLMSENIGVVLPIILSAFYQILKLY
jgi:hypothetical protein